MVAILKRMTKLRALLAIRTGPGAALLPPNVSRIQMKFAYRWNDGHLGPRKFWRQYLPNLKYQNPAVPMSVERSADQEGPATMTIHFTDESGKTATKDIAMKHRHERDIWSDFLEMTQAQPLQPTTEDVALAKVYEEKAEKRKLDIALKIRAEEEKQRKAQLLAAARAGLTN